MLLLQNKSMCFLGMSGQLGFLNFGGNFSEKKLKWGGRGVVG